MSNPNILYPLNRILLSNKKEWISDTGNNMDEHQKRFFLKVAQLYPTLCDSMDYTVHRILQARTLEWVTFPFSRGSSQPRDQTQVSHITGRFFTFEPQRKPKHPHGNWKSRMCMCVYLILLII